MAREPASTPATGTRRWGPPAGASVAVLGVAAVLYVLGTRAAGGQWAYPLDDAYIHMEVAWQWLTQGTWGLNPGEPASASSSPLWTVVLAGTLALVGHATWAPLLLGALAAVGAVGVADRALVRDGMGPGARLGALLGLALVAPLPVLAVLGMEHGLQVLLTLACVPLAVRVVDEDAPLLAWGLGALTLLCGTRFEGTFLAATWGLLLALRGRGRAALAVWLCGAAPVVLFGAVSLAMGNAVLPNGLLMKSPALNGDLLAGALASLRDGAPVLAPVALVWVLEGARGGRWRGTGRARLLAGTALLHLGLAKVGWYYRYEAWLVAWSALELARAGQVWWRRPRLGHRGDALVGLLGVATVLVLGQRAFEAHRYLPSRCVYISDVKVHLAEALAEVSPSAVVAVHDVGAMAWATDLRVVDTAGLGTDEVLALARSRRFTGQTIGALTVELGATVGAATRSWMADDPPAGWRPVGVLDWGLDEDRRIEGVVVYAIAPGSEAVARAWLAAAAARMGGRGAAVPLEVGEPRTPGP